MSKRVAVIGAGASGLAASIAASEKNGVVIYEKETRPGRKILATGNGKCNIANRNLSPDRFHATHKQFVNHVFGRFGLAETEKFFLELGLPFAEENLGRLFPNSKAASSVVDLLVYCAQSKGVLIHTLRKVTVIDQEGSRFRVTDSLGNKEHFDAVILAAGSAAYPSLGGSAGGYDLARSLGHTIIEPFPSIVPLSVEDRELNRLQGTRWVCNVTVIGGETEIETTGEVQFTAYGLSGPAILDVARHINCAKRTNRKVVVKLDLMPDFSADDLARTLTVILSDARKPLELALSGIIKKNIARFILHKLKLDEKAAASQVTEKMISMLVCFMKSMECFPGDPRAFDEAVVAAGGVNVREINPATMESKIVPGLFITGELLDVDGDSGGFNLQFAWSSGIIAGSSV